MLDQLEMAIRRYEQIAPSPGAAMTQAQADQLSEWLESDVGRIVASLLTRPGFRRRARWPIERLTGELDCPERVAVLAVDGALVQFARRLSSVARTDTVSTRLLRLGPYQNEVREGDPSALDPQPESEVLPPLPLGLRQVEFILSRPWRDLTSALDYFHPTSQLNIPGSDGIPWGNFLPYFNKRLRSPGDFITRCMEIRVNHWQEGLQRFFVRCHTARQMAAGDLGIQWSELERSSADLQGRIANLRSLCLEGQDARVRDACIVLLQMYVGFHQDADVSWLGPVAAMVRDVSDVPSRVRRNHQWEVPERAAAALIDIADLVRRPQAPEDVIEEMKTTRRLVLIEEQREGFLDGKPIEATEHSAYWHGRDNLLWELLWTLADRARLRRTVDCYCLSNPKAREVGEPPTYQAVKDRRSDLRKRIVPELNQLIVDAGLGTYRLELEADQICLLGWFSEDRLDVVPPLVPRTSHP